MYTKKNQTILPFEDATSIEFFGKKNDTSLFMLTSHSKKRPNNLIMGRLFDYQLMDMMELGVEKFVAMNEFKVWLWIVCFKERMQKLETIGCQVRNRLEAHVHFQRRCL
jgi:hypothetical protein